MAKHRILDDDFWTDPKLRRLSWHCRTLLIALITTICDDEGRFEVDHFGMLDTIFSRTDPVTEDDIAKDIQDLADCGIIILYGDGAYGFLKSWYKRQIIRSSNRVPSTLPEPPQTEAAPITSWAMLDELTKYYMQIKSNQRKTWNTTIAQWYASLTEKERKEVIKNTTLANSTLKNSKVEKSSVKNATLAESTLKNPEIAESSEQYAKVRAEGKGREGKGITTLSHIESLHEEGVPPPQPPDWERENKNLKIPVPTDPVDMNIRRVSPEMIGAAVNRVFTGSRAIARDRWRLKLIEVAKDQHTPLSEEELIAALSEDTPSSVDTPETWCRRLLAKKSSRQRSAQQGNPLPPNTEKVITDEFGQVIPNASG